MFKFISYLFASPRKRHFITRLRNIEVSIWDKEYLKHQAREIREGVRLDRDRALEAADALKIEVAKDHAPETKKELEDRLAHQIDNAQRFEAQIKMLDEQVEGRPYSPASEGKEADPGVQGINDTLGSLAEMRKMLTSYLKKI